MKPYLQVALDFLDLPRALKVAEEAVEGGADWIEAGTPLIKSEGLQSVRELKKRFPQHLIVADMKTIDAGRAEVESAFKAGARIVHILGSASDETVRECLDACENYGGEIVGDLIECHNPLKRAKELQKLGVHYIGVHCAIDRQMKGVDPFLDLKKISRVVQVPLSVAGGINSETAKDAVELGATVVVVGGAIIKSADAKEATQKIKLAMQSKVKIKTGLYKRATEENVREILEKVSSCNISDAMHRKGDIVGIYPVVFGTKMVGKVFTVRTYPGDWAKPVEAIDLAEEGDVIVIDAGGVGPAVWGELATYSSMQRKIKGVVIDGAIRDTTEIKRLNFPAFAKIITPTAGEPKGFGETGIPVMLGGVRVHPGDWIVGDDDGVIVIPKEKVVEITNRAMDILEKENRLRDEIKKGSTLSQVAYLEKWEKK